MNHYSLTTTDGRDVQLAMQELWLGGKLLPMGARLVARHVFESAEDVPLEVVYAFMLPRDAALRSFRIEGEGFSVKSELQPVQRAEETYEQAMQEGKLACQTRNYRDGVTNLMVGNLQPGQRVTVHLEILAGVEVHDDGFRFRFPFTLAPSYHPQARASVNEKGEGEMELPAETFGDVLLPPWRDDASSLHRIGFDLAVGVPGGMASVESPSHSVRFNLEDSDSCRVSLAPDRDVPNRDLVLEVKVREPKPLLWSGPDEIGRTSCAAWIPSTAFGEGTQQPSRVVFVLDRSGSMGGDPMEQAKSGLLACLDNLTDDDEFCVLAFDTRIESPALQLFRGTEECLDRARGFLKGIRARGGTQIKEALVAAANILGGEKGDIFLITDGQAYGTEDIIQRLRSLGQRVHTLGIGSASQDRFISQVSRQTGGQSRFLGVDERIDDAALTLFAGIKQPLAADLSIRIEGEGGSIEPAVPALISTGMPANLFGRADRLDAVVCHMTQNGEPRDLRLTSQQSEGALGETLRLLRGARLITDLEAQIGAPPVGVVAQREHKRLEGRLEAISREYQLASKAMSLVAVVDAVQDLSGMVPSTRVVPVGMPTSTRSDSYFGRSLDIYDQCFGGSTSGMRRSVRDHDEVASDSLIDRSIASSMEVSARAMKSSVNRKLSCIDSCAELESPSPALARKTPPQYLTPEERIIRADAESWLKDLWNLIKSRNALPSVEPESGLILEILAAMMYNTVQVGPGNDFHYQSKRLMVLLSRFLRSSTNLPELPDQTDVMARRIVDFVGHPFSAEARSKITERFRSRQGVHDAGVVSSVYREFFAHASTNA